MNSGDKLHVGIAVILFLGLFSFTMLPKPVAGLGDFFQGAAFSMYKAARFSGFATDEGMCILADLWNLGGLDAKYVPVGETGGISENGLENCNSDCDAVFNNCQTTTCDAELADCIDTCDSAFANLETISCATLSEMNISIVPKDREIYGGGLQGTLFSVRINDKRTLNKLFYVSYALFGLVLAAVVTDMWLSTRAQSYSTAKMMGLMAMTTLGVMMTIFRTGLIWPLLSTIANTIPGSTIIGDMLFIGLGITVFWWMISQVTLGFHIARANQERFAAIRVAGRADYQRGMAAIGSLDEKTQ